MNQSETNIALGQMSIVHIYKLRQYMIMWFFFWPAVCEPLMQRLRESHCRQNKTIYCCRLMVTGRTIPIVQEQSQLSFHFEPHVQEHL